jgi:hypothetical protein
MDDERARIETVLYDAEGRRTDDDALAVRAEVVELDAAGKVVRRLADGGLGWKVDPKSLEGSDSEAATRPEHPPDE